MAASLHYTLAVEKHLVVHIDSVDQECTQILAVLGNSSQDSDWRIEQDNLAEKAVEDNLVDLYIVVDLAQLEVYLW